MTAPTRRGARTRFDRTGRNTILAAAAVVLVAAGALIALYVITQRGATSRAFNVAPRNLDLWAVYPDGRLRFATLFYLDDDVPSGSDTEIVEAAGPLVSSEEDVQSSEVIGGTLDSSEMQPGPGQDSTLLFELFSIERERAGEPYGVDVFATNAPYLADQGDGTTILSLGAEEQQSYVQVIVAVALPAETSAQVNEDIESYREARVGGWDVYYFDATQAQAGQAIRMQFTLGQGAPPDLDVFRVDAQR